MTTDDRRPSALRAAELGAAAGFIASFVQVGVGLVLARFLLPPGHDNNIAPRLVQRTTSKVGAHTPKAVDWLLGSLFHIGYALFWGVLFGVTRERTHLPSLPLGLGMGGLIYALAFSRGGAGTKSGAERHPSGRPRSKQVSLVTVAMTYAVTTALLYERLRGSDHDLDVWSEAQNAVSDRAGSATLDRGLDPQNIPG